MMLLKQTLYIAISLGFVFAWYHSPMAVFTIPLLGLLVAIFLLISIMAKRGGKNPFEVLDTNSSLSIMLLITTILLLIFSTGGLSSILFFLLYFLCFGISFVFEPATVFVFAIGIILVFLPNLVNEDPIANGIRIGSLLLIAPLGFFFGREFRREEQDEAKIEEMAEVTKDAADTIAADVDQVLKDSEKVLKSEQIEKLDEILEETEVLRQESEK